MPIAWGYERLRPEPPGASAREDWVPRLGGGWWSTCSKRGFHSSCRRGHLKWSIPGRCSRDPHPDGALLAGTPPRGFPIRSARPGPRSCEPGSRGPTLHSRISEGGGAGAGTQRVPCGDRSSPGGRLWGPPATQHPRIPSAHGEEEKEEEENVTQRPGNQLLVHRFILRSFSKQTSKHFHHYLCSSKGTLDPKKVPSECFPWRF